MKRKPRKGCFGAQSRGIASRGGKSGTREHEQSETGPLKEHTINEHKDPESYSVLAVAGRKFQQDQAARSRVTYSNVMTSWTIRLAIALPILAFAAETGTVEPKDLATQLQAAGSKPALIHVGFAISQVDEEEARATRDMLERMGADYER